MAGRLLDVLAPPARPVLIGQQHQLAGAGESCFTPSVLQQHEGEQGPHVGLAGQQGLDRPRQDDRLRGQLGAHRCVAARRRVALGEHQVQHHQHAAQPHAELVRCRHAERDAGGGDLLLGPGDALGHRRLRYEEEASDLGDAQPTDEAQRERHAGLHLQCGVAADEHEAQPLVVDRGLARSHQFVVHPFLEARCDVVHHELGQAALVGGLGAHAIDDPAPRRGQEPRRGVVGHAVLTPPDGGGDERLLHAVLGEVEPP